MQQDHYLALGVSSSASLADIKKAYRHQAARHHPDRSTAPDAATRFRAVQEAYDILGDEARREAYDNNRKRNLLDDPLETARGIWADYFQRLI
jgi:DnaJ-class molecular chaperone